MRTTPWPLKEFDFSLNTLILEWGTGAGSGLDFHIYFADPGLLLILCEVFCFLFLFFLNHFFLFIYLAALGLRCYTRAFSSCGEQGLLFVVGHRLLTAVASLVAEPGL